MRIQLHHHIYADSGILDGQPCIEGTRIPASVLITQVAAGKPLADVARAYHVSLAAVRAALEFAAERASQAPPLDDPLFELAGALPDGDASSGAAIPGSQCTPALEIATDDHVIES